ncbi:hypothetical protein II906_05810 [bacterium]|nr:hypothetical protein [bacterium]
MKALSQALECCEQNFSHSDIINILASNDDIEKQLALIELNSINSQEEADILISNLTGKSGPIRETSSYKILELIQDTKFNNYFQNTFALDSIIKSITDINPSVSRYAVETIRYIDDVDYIYNKIIENINLTLSNLDKETKNRSYVQNKKNFNLYWNLEALISLSDKITPDDNLLEILNITAKSNDYTIREKTAKCAFCYTNRFQQFANILKILENDENIYVQKYSKQRTEY